MQNCISTHIYNNVQHIQAPCRTSSSTPGVGTSQTLLAKLPDTFLAFLAYMYVSIYIFTYRADTRAWHACAWHACATKPVPRPRDGSTGCAGIQSLAP